MRRRAIVMVLAAVAVVLSTGTSSFGQTDPLPSWNSSISSSASAEFTKAVTDWIAAARHPRFNRLDTDTSTSHVGFRCIVRGGE
jgi:hypothetical protein